MNFREIFKIVKSDIRVFSLCSILILSITLLFLLFSNNSYKSYALLAPSNENLSEQAQTFKTSSLVSLGLGAVSGDVATIELETLKSFDFFSFFIKKNNNLEDLIAVESYDNILQTITYDKKLYNPAKDKFVNYDDKNDHELLVKSHSIFLEKLTITPDARSGFVKLSLESNSPIIAKKLLDQVIKSLNMYIAETHVKKAEKYLAFLTIQANNTKYDEVKKSIVYLIQKQIQTLMLASESDEFSYKVIQKPFIPITESGASKLLILIIGFVLSILISLSVVIIRNLFR